MKLLFALGNPSDQYAQTRHNTGFFMIDQIAQAHHATFRSIDTFNASIAKLSIAGETIILAKPTTFYNDVGRSYQAITAFYKMSIHDSMIIHDELALPLGTLRTRQGGSHAGNNGIKSVIQYGGEQSYRLRIGIETDLRQHVDDAAFVLGRFTANEHEILSQLVPHVLEQVHVFITEGHTTTTFSL